MIAQYYNKKSETIQRLRKNTKEEVKKMKINKQKQPNMIQLYTNRLWTGIVEANNSILPTKFSTSIGSIKCIRMCWCLI